MQEVPEPRTWTPREAVQQPPSYEYVENDFRAVTPPPPSREPSWDATERHRPASQYQSDRPQVNSQYDITVHRDALEDIELRHRRQSDVEIDRKSDRVSHPASNHRSSLSHDSRPIQMSNDRYDEETYRPRDAPSPTTHRRLDSFSGHVTYAHEAHRQNISDDRRVTDTITERQVHSWDREPPPHRELLPHAERSSSSHDRNIRKADHSSVNHNPPATPVSKIIRIRRPGSPATQDDVRDYPMHYEAPDGWKRLSSRGEQHGKDAEGPLSIARRPEPSSRRGGSLLDRLSLDNGLSSPVMSPQSLRDRVQVPSKRDREDIGNDSAGDIDIDDGGLGDTGLKRPRRRLRPKRGRRNGT